MTNSPRFCIWCGHEMRQGGQFCTVCGRAALDGNQGGAAASAEPAPADDMTMNPPAPLSPGAARPDSAASRSSDTTTDGLGKGSRADAHFRPARSVPASGRTSPADDRHRSRWPFVVSGAAVLALGAAAAVVFIVHPFRHSVAVAGAHSASPGAAAQSEPVPSIGSSSQSSQQQAAASLAGLLSRSVSDRNSVVQAVRDVNQCGSGLDQDSQTFQDAAASRQQLLSQLAALPDRSALPGTMLKALTDAWQASVQADQDYAHWAEDEASQGCKQNDHSDANYQAATGPDNQATIDKRTFSAVWDPIAATYDLTPYRWDQL